MRPALSGRFPTARRQLPPGSWQDRVTIAAEPGCPPAPTGECLGQSDQPAPWTALGCSGPWAAAHLSVTGNQSVGGKPGMTTEDGNGATRRRSIQSIEIGMRILKALSTLGAAASLSSIAQVVAMPPPQVHRYLQSLLASGMARQDAASGRYDLGPEALQIGLAALARIDVFKIVDRAVSEFVEHSGQTVQISALGSAGPTIVRIYNGRPALLTTLHIGAVLPLLASATGQVFLAYVPESETAAIAEREQGGRSMPAPTPDAIREAVRRAGKATESESVIPGLHATAFPIFDLQGRALLVATALTAGPATGLRADAVLELGKLCARISAEAGWVAQGRT